MTAADERVLHFQLDSDLSSEWDPEDGNHQVAFYSIISHGQEWGMDLRSERPVLKHGKLMFTYELELFASYYPSLSLYRAHFTFDSRITFDELPKLLNVTVRVPGIPTHQHPGPDTWFEIVQVGDHAFGGGHLNVPLCNVKRPCDICLERGPPDAVWAQLPCQHNFHLTCIAQWAASPSNRNCPYCRAPYKTARIPVCDRVEHSELQANQGGAGVGRRGPHATRFVTSSKLKARLNPSPKPKPQPKPKPKPKTKTKPEPKRKPKVARKAKPLS